MAVLEIIGPRHDPGVCICRMTCLEKSIPHRFREVAWGSKSASRENQMGILPALRHGKVRLFTPRGITSYLENRFNRKPLVPKDPIRACEVEQWISFVEGRLQVLMNSGSCPGHETWQQTHTCLTALSDLISNRMCLVGRGFSLADIWLMPAADSILQQIGQAQMLHDYPALALWFQKHSERKSWIALNSAEEISP